MKLTATQIKQVEDQIGMSPISDDEPFVSQLSEVFGDHTFYLQEDGLHMLTLHAELEYGAQVANMVHVAQWSTDEAISLVPCEPDLTDIYVDLSAPEETPAP